MARAVYSTQFLAAQGSGFGAVSYVVPAAFVAVVRDIALFQSPGAAGDLIVVDAPSSGYLLAEAEAGGDNVTVHWTGNLVLNAGQQIIASGFGTAAQAAVVSGYLLTA